jgi:hypothetical protein
LRGLFSNKNLIVDAAILIFIGIFLLSFFEPQYLFLKTTTNGGDTGSHYPCAAYLKEVLLPQGKIMGWMQGNYAGFPLFYHYFPLPFMLMAGISFVAPLEVAFKLVTALGTFLLPLCVYFAFRFMKYAFPAPIIAAILTLPFLFNQGNSMWGGNIPSTLAGEFCYSLGFALVFLFFGSIHRGVEEGKYLLFNALLVFLIGFSHAYTLIFSLMLGAYFLIIDFKRNYKYLIAVYGLGLLFLSFWLLPVLANAPYTTSFIFRWKIHSLFEVFPPAIIPFVGLALPAWFYDHRDKRVAYFTYAVLACVFVYLVGPRIGVLDIRLVPFFQLLLVLLGSTALWSFAREVKWPFLFPLIIFLATVIWVNINTTYIRQWIVWNYTGFEEKKTWPVFQAINEHLRHSGTGRVEWEHTPLDEPLGSIRASETLPYFAKRQTLEGIHMIGALSAPFVFYIESETSHQPCNPIPDYFYSAFDLKSGIAHFKQFNVSHFVVRSDPVKSAMRQYPEFKLEKSIGGYEIYRLATCNEEYVVPLVNHPVLFSTNDWRDVSYQWFAREGSGDTVLVFNKPGGEPGEKNFDQAGSDLNAVKNIPYKHKAVKVKSVINNESIEIETSEIGRPLLIKVSYHPNWKVTGADRIYFASPCFMLIFPQEKKVRLDFAPGREALLGGGLTGLGLLLACFSPLWLKKVKERLPDDRGVRWGPILLFAGAALVFYFTFDYLNPGPDTLLRKGREAFEHKRYSLAREKLGKVLETAKMSSGQCCEAGMFYALTFVRENNFVEGKQELNRFIQDYPVAFWSPQAYFDLAYCESMLGNAAVASQIYRQIMTRFPLTTWARYSESRLNEIKRAK